MYLLDNLPPYEFDYKNYNKEIKHKKSETLQLLYSLSFFFVLSFALYNIISFLNVQIEYNKMIMFNSNTEYKQTSYNAILFLLVIDMILNMMYYVFTSILINKNMTTSRYYTLSCILCIITIIGMLCIIHHNILNKISEYMNSIIMIDSANYYNLLKHIRISTILYFTSYLINIVTVIYLF